MLSAYNIHPVVLTPFSCLPLFLPINNTMLDAWCMQTFLSLFPWGKNLVEVRSSVQEGSLFCSVARGCSRWILPNVKKLNQVMLWGFRTICTLISLLCFSIASMEFTNTAITGNATVSSTQEYLHLSLQLRPTGKAWTQVLLEAPTSTMSLKDSNGTTAVTSGKISHLKPPEGCYQHLGEH